MPSKQHTRSTSSRTYSHEGHHGGPISDQQPSSTDTPSGSCSPLPPYDATHPSSYCRTRLSPTAPVSRIIAPELVYRSPFRGRVTPARSRPRSPKRQKLLSVHAAEKSLLVLELFGFLTAYTTLCEDQRIWILEKVFKDVDWEGCADMDEGKGDGLGYPYNLYDQNDAGPGGVCRWILELPEAHITTAFGELVSRIVEAGWEVEGILFPPGAETLVEVQESPDINPTWFNWTVASGRAGPTEPITYQAVPELALSQVPLYDRDPMDPQIVAERTGYLQNYLEQCSDGDLDQAPLDKKKKIRAHVSVCEKREKETRERYWRLVGGCASALSVGASDNNSSMFSEMASGVSTEDLSSIRSSGSVITPNRTQIDDWAFNCTSDGANSKAPLLEPSPLFRRSESPKQEAAGAGFGDQWEFGDVPTCAEEEERMMQHALRASMRVSTEKLPSPSIDNAVHWEDPNKVPWLNSRFQDSIFYNNLLVAQSEPLIVMQAKMDLGSGSEPPPPPKNTKLPELKPIEDVEMRTDELNQERAKLEVADKGKDQMQSGKRPDRKRRNMRGVFSDLRAMSNELNSKFTSKGRERGKVVKGTVEEMNRPKTGRAKPVEPVTENVSELLNRYMGEENWEYVSYSDYPHSDHRKSDDESIYDKPPTERMAEAFRAEEIRRSDPFRPPSPKPKKRGIPEITIVLPEKKRDVVLERISKEESKIRKSDKVSVIDLALRAENNAAYHKAKAAEEAGPEAQRSNAEPDIRYFDPRHEVQESLRKSNERKRYKKRESDERKSREKSGEGSKQPPVKSLIPPDSADLPGPVVPPKRKHGERKSREQSGEGSSKQAPVKSLIPPDSPGLPGPVVPPERKPDERKSREQSGEGSSKRQPIKSLIPPDSPGLPGPAVPPEPEISSGPGGSSNPGTPTVAGNPPDPGTPTAAGNPANPGTPTVAGNPANPGTPTVAGNPADPGTPTAAGNPANPETPTKTSAPVEPATTGEVGKPSEALETEEQPNQQNGQRRRRKWLCC